MGENQGSLSWLPWIFGRMNVSPVVRRLSFWLTVVLGALGLLYLIARVLPSVLADF